MLDCHGTVQLERTRVPYHCLSDEVEFGEVIGNGGQGQVQRGVYKSQPIALKTCTIGTEEDFVRFAKEIKILSLLKHKNIVKFIGIVLQRNKVFLATELMDMDLSSAMHFLNYEQKLRVAKNISSGM